ncbi:MAG: hypothetical protein ACKOX3_03785 [Bacteroidota bacterium]
MKKLLFIVGISSLFFGCGSKEKEQSSVYNNDFEVMGNWSSKDQLTSEASHSGTFATYTDSTLIFSQTMVASCKGLKNKSPKSLTATVWAMSKLQNAKGKLVLSIDKNDKSVVWQGSDIQNTVKVPNKWDLVQLKIDLKEPLTEDMVIKLYGLNEGKSKVYWDDFSLTFE